MLKYIPVKKEYLLIIASLFLLFLSYRFAFKNTIDAWRLNKELTNQVARSTDLSVQPAYSERKSANLDRIIKQYKTDTAEFRNNVVSSISIIADKENVKLSELPLQDPLYHTDRFIVQKISFEGDYFALIRVINYLHSAENIGFIRSISCRAVKSHSNAEGVQKVILDCYIEVIK